MRICIVSRNLPPVYSGGGQQAVLLAESFIKQGHEAVLVGKEFAEASSAIESVPVWRVRHTASTRIAEHLALVRLLFRERHRYDSILFFGVDGGFYQFWRWLPLVKVLRKPSVARFTIASSSGSTQRRLGATVPCLLHDRIITISTALTQSVKNQLPSWRHPHVIQISNGVDVGKFHPLNGTSRSRQCLELGLDPSHHYCIFVGRLSHRKGLDLLVESWRHIVSTCPHARLLLVGPRRDDYREVEDTQFLDSIDDYVREHGLRNSVLEIGFTDQVDRYLQVADVFLSTSRREGCPNAVLEAMATGTPVVVSRISNTTDDLITDQVDGFITEPDPAAFAHAVIAVLSCSELKQRVGEAARRSVLARHDIDRVAGLYLEILAACR